MIGVDEVGRGCWAGPLLVVAARETGQLPMGLADSKVLSKKKRSLLYYEIQIACELGEGWVTVAEINDLGLSRSLYLGVERALYALGAGSKEEIVLDGKVNYCPMEYSNVTCAVDADATIPIVSAASIYAKVLRDNQMAEISKSYPNYRFEKHVGYGTKLHRDMIRQYGICELHRINWRPFQKSANV